MLKKILQGNVVKLCRPNLYYLFCAEIEAPDGLSEDYPAAAINRGAIDRTDACVRGWRKFYASNILMALESRWKEIGFVRCSANPAFLARTRSDSCP